MDNHQSNEPSLAPINLKEISDLLRTERLQIAATQHVLHWCFFSQNPPIN